MEVTGFNFPSTPTGHQSGPVPTNYHGELAHGSPTQRSSYVINQKKHHISPPSESSSVHLIWHQPRIWMQLRPEPETRILHLESSGSCRCLKADLEETNNPETDCCFTWSRKVEPNLMVVSSDFILFKYV